jgi:hypothetical protein
MQLTFAAQNAPRNHRFVGSKIDIAVGGRQKKSGHVRGRFQGQIDAQITL